MTLTGRGYVRVKQTVLHEATRLLGGKVELTFTPSRNLSLPIFAARRHLLELLARQ